MAEDSTSEAFGLLLAHAREERGLSIRAAARRADLSEGLWRQLEKGYRQVTADIRVPTNPRPSTVRAAAAAVSLSISEALTAAGHPQEAEEHEAHASASGITDDDLLQMLRRQRAELEEAERRLLERRSISAT